MRLIVVGGGIVGVATARLAALEIPSASVLLLEKEDRLAQHQTGRNSGVLHAGLYYTPGSLKARLCRRGATLMAELCRTRSLPFQECGKLVLATEQQELPRLSDLAERASANGVPRLRELDAAGLRELEPHARGLAALHSPSTAIVDFAAVTRSLASELVQRGGEVRCGAAVRAVRRRAPMSGRASAVRGTPPTTSLSGGTPAANSAPRGAPPTTSLSGGTPAANSAPRSTSPTAAEVVLADGATLAADRVVVCAGVNADRLAQASGEPASPRIVPFRGEYWKLRPERSELVKGLIYPVPDPSLPFLGVHLTRRLDGEVWIGPNAVLALARERYARGSLVPRDALQSLSWGGTWRMAATHWRAGAGELRRSLSKRAFVEDARRYVPELSARDVIRAPAGIRAQAIDADGILLDDFRLDRAGPVCWVRNAPSPAATSSLAIAEELLDATLDSAPKVDS